MEFLLTCFAAGVIVAVPVWIVWQRGGSRRRFAAMRGFDPNDAVRCEIEPVALRAWLLPDAHRIDEAAQ
ncbi:hypothetical protein [Paraburkholderia ginsengisoli]|uniref:Uncharacterized protein n=1 Tax=Paraburkholderia ginsengisoli TaxID=311231 RepID=A0A7T4N4I3_9BURK|nr:hypothetical protein [Paraburkholderia ginsengisoli]QQC65050.1 hypothetical protein I6I06_06160 [Paraburkholderia ginsengisoli]